MRLFKYFSIPLICMLCFNNVYAQKDTIIVKSSLVCEMCKHTIEDGLRFEKGVKLATVDIESKTITVIYNSQKTNPKKIRTEISKMGYDADNMPADTTAYDKLRSCCKKNTPRQ